MANTIDSLVLQDDGVYYRLRYQCLSDGTGADLTDQVMVDKSAITKSLATNAEPTSLDLIEIVYAQAWGLTRVELEWDRGTDDEIIAFGSQCDISLNFGGTPLREPAPTTATTGDILVTTKGMAANGGFVIIATFMHRTPRT